MKRLCSIFMLAVLLIGLPVLSDAQDSRGRILFVATVGDNKVLLRWMGTKETGRFSGFNIHRREGGSASFTNINFAPIRPLATISEIRAVFETPGEGLILSDIQTLLGPYYYDEILRFRKSGESSDLMQLALLVNTNYGVSITEGLGFLDRNVAGNKSYVYELWGVDGAGTETERLGKVNVIAGKKTELSAPQELEWVKIIGPTGDRKVYLRWKGLPAKDIIEKENASIGFGYDIYRKKGSDTNIISDVVINNDPLVYYKANALPVIILPAQDVQKGKELFATNCSTSQCHLTRNDTRISGKAVREFRSAEIQEHASLSPDLDLTSIFNYINDFFFMDENSITAGPPLEYGDYTYWVVARDLLRQHGTFSNPVIVTVRDTLAPKVPYNVRTSVIGDVPNQKKIKVTWDRNMSEPNPLNEPGKYLDDTMKYNVYRRFGNMEATKTLVGSVDEPRTGHEVTIEYADISITRNDWGNIYWYHITAVDVHGNESAFSGPAKGIVYDLEPPLPPVCNAFCEIEYDNKVESGLISCKKYTPDRGPDIVTFAYVRDTGDPTKAPYFPTFTCSRPADSDVEGIKVYRSFNGQDFYYLKDVHFTVGDNEIEIKDDNYLPRVSQQAYYKFKAFDENTNVSDFSVISGMTMIVGEPPPAPIIVGMKHIASSMAPDGIVDTVDILISVLNPDGVAGFKLYRASSSEGTGASPLLVDPSPNANWGKAELKNSTTDVPVKYGISLAKLPAGGMEDDNSKVTFDQDKRYYILRAKNVPSPTRGKYYAVTALDFAGQESDAVYYFWSGDDIAGPGRNLPWPIRDRKKPKALTLSFRPANQNPGEICLNWEVNGKIVDENNELFLPYLYYVVFRVRGNPNPDRFVQVSRLLTGPFYATQGPGYDPEEYCDKDIMPGETYTYVVLGIKKDNYINTFEDEKKMDSNHGEIDESFGPASMKPVE